MELLQQEIYGIGKESAGWADSSVLKEEIVRAKCYNIDLYRVTMASGDFGSGICGFRLGGKLLRGFFIALELPPAIRLHSE